MMNATEKKLDVSVPTVDLQKQYSLENIRMIYTTADDRYYVAMPGLQPDNYDQLSLITGGLSVDEVLNICCKNGWVYSVEPVVDRMTEEEKALYEVALARANCDESYYDKCKIMLVGLENKLTRNKEIIEQIRIRRGK